MNKLTLLLVIFFIIHNNVSSQVNLRHFSEEQGLPGATVQDLFQDQYGIMWLGIESLGLCKYNGNDFSIYENIPNDSTSISNNFVYSIVEDHFGSLWVGTGEGLNKFDRTTGTFTRFLHNEGDEQALPGNRIYDLLLDKHGFLWIGTNKGLSKYNIVRNEFIHLLTPSENNNLEITVSSIDEDIDGNIWVGTEEKGLQRISARNNLLNANEWKDKSVGEITEKLQFAEGYLYEVKNNGQNSYLRVYSVQIDSSQIYIGTGLGGGLSVYDIASKEMSKMEFAKMGVPILDNSSIAELLIDKNKQLWIGASTNGLGIFNLDSKELIYMDAKSGDRDGIRSNSIRAIYEDLSGLIWISSKFEGLYLYDPRQTIIKLLQKNNTGKCLSDNYVMSVAEDQDHDIWIGTKTGGLNVYNPKDHSFKIYMHDRNNSHSIYSNRIECIFIEDKNTIWIGSDKGLECFNKNEQLFKHFGDFRIRFILPRNSEEFWIGSHEEGLFLFDTKTKQFTRHTSKNPSFFSNNSYAFTDIIQDTQGRFWFATESNGLFLYNEATDSLKHFLKNKNNPGSIRSNQIRSIIEDKNGIVWIGTKSDGLNKYDPDNNSFTVLTKEDGLSSNSVYSILQDDNGDLWMGTANGISKYNIPNNKFENFSERYGLQGKIFEPNAYLKASDGTMYFGGSNGLNYFNPLKTYKRKYNSPMMITAFKKYDEVIDSDINGYKEYVLDYKDDYLSIEYALLDYRGSQNNRYSYKLENFDSQWINAGNRNFASYTSLPSGEYVFRVKGSNIDGDCNEGSASIKIIIPAPFWEKNWFILSLILVLVIIIYSIYKARINSIRKNEKNLKKIVEQKTIDLQNANQALARQKEEIEKHNKSLIEQSGKIKSQNQELEAHRNHLEQLVSIRTSALVKAKEKAEESDNLKTAFLANLSHEIRTPMNGILGFAELLKNEDLTKGNKDKYVSLIEQSGDRMLRLIQDLVDISKIESNQIEIIPEKTNLNSLMEKIYNFFKPQVDAKGIKLTLIKGLSNNESQIIVDKIKLEQILSNIINNAIKFTKEGRIDLSYSLSDKMLYFKIKDTGIGIPKQKEKIIFERFGQAENYKYSGTEGSGLGLSISKAFIELMGGDIWVESEQGQGAEFTFTIPYNPVDKEINKEQNRSEFVFPNDITILIAEDDEVSYFYLERILSNYNCKIIHARNGLEAVQFFNENPEIGIILMDLKMTGMDGISATSEIRKISTRVAILAQTAYASDGDQQKALDAGCNDYIIKPINKELLVEKIVKLLRMRNS